MSKRLISWDRALRVVVPVLLACAPTAGTPDAGDASRPPDAGTDMPAPDVPEPPDAPLLPDTPADLPLEVPGADAVPGEDLVPGDAPGEPDTPPDAPTDTPTDAPTDTPPAPDLPPRRSLAEGFHVAPDFPEPGRPFSVIVASDPQLWWNSIDGRSDVSDAEVEAQNRLHIDAMNALIAGEGLPEGQEAPRVVVMNGDLTEYGRWAQWDAYYRLYEQVRAPILDGLGNHDYENNNPHVSNGCAMDAFEFVAWQEACEAGSDATLWGRPACEVAEGLLEGHDWCALDTMRRMRHWLATHAAHLRDWDEGSAAYSWDMGGVHFVQLHDFPAYEVPETTICSSLDWLRGDLRAAFDRGQRIVLNVHRPVTADLAPVLLGYQYNIVGIFYGHIHQYAGYDGDLVVGGVPIPRFYGGSVQWNLFTLAAFQADRMTVTAIDSNTGIPVHHATSGEYDNLGGASASAPFTYAFPANPCPAGQVPEGGPDGPCAVLDTPVPPVVRCF